MTIKKNLFILSLFTLFTFLSSAQAQNINKASEDLVLALEKDYPPFLFFENNTPQGISYDYSQLVAEKIGSELKVTQPMQLQDMLDAVKKGEANLLSDITKTPERDEFLEFSQPYVETPAVVISRSNEKTKWNPEDKNVQVKIATGKGYGVTSYLKEKYPEADYLELASDAEVIKAVALGASDVGVLDAGSLSYLLQKDPISNIYVVGETGFLYSLSFAVPEEKKDLINLINKGINSISKEERNEIYAKWLSTIPKQEEKIISKKVFWGVILLAFITSLSILWTLALRKEVERQTRSLKEVNKNLDFTISEKVEEALRIKNEAEKRSKMLEKTKRAMINILEDLQEERKLLAEGKAKDDAVLKNIGDGLVATDEKGLITLVNPAFESILDLKFDDIKGKKLVDVLKMFNEEGKLVPESERLILRCLKEKINLTANIIDNKYYKKKDGSLFPVAVNISPIILDGKLLGVVEIFRDVTREREVDEAKTEFVSLASHQLRTPLTSIKLFLEIFLAQPSKNLSRVQKDYLEKIKISNDRMIGLVNDLLNVSRLENGRIAISPILQSLETLLEQSVVQINKIAQEKKIKIRYKKSGNYPPKIPLDSGLFNEVMTCLLSNAVRYTEAKKGQITVENKQTKSGHIISVADNGIGIGKKEQKNIFKKFFRADNAKEKEPDGSGLGLYIAEMIIRTSGGKITFQSSLGKGTTFFIHLPLKGMLAHAGDKQIA